MVDVSLDTIARRAGAGARRREESELHEACRDRLYAWLVSPDVASADGRVVSWVSPTRPGFSYPEAAALWLDWAAWRQERGEAAPASALIAAVATRLWHEFERGGGVGKNGRVYLFDSLLAARALAAANQRGWLSTPPETLAAVVAASVDQFEPSAAPVLPGPVGLPRWSESWGGFLLRAAAALYETARLLDEPRLDEAATGLVARLAALPRGPREPYTHAWLYGVEGALRLGAAAEARAEAEAAAGLQRDDGGLPGWNDRLSQARSDATAQAIRLWVALDAVRFAGPVAQAAKHLVSRQQASGGLPYEPGSDDAPTWAALFADQALAWAAAGPGDEVWI